MAFLPGFEHDVFISYAHVDNLSATTEQPWVEQFHKQLEIALARRIGRMGVVKIWRDKRLEGDQLFDQTIKDAIDQSAILVALTSNGYLASDYAQQELQWFHKKAGVEPHSLQIGDRSRIYNILLNNIPHDHWPGEYGRITGYPFHDAEEEDVPGQPTDPATDKQRFQKQLRALADSLYKMLTAFKETIGQLQSKEVEEQLPTADDAPKVFLADVTDSLDSIRKRVIAELKRKGIRVDTGVPPPYEAQAHEEKVKLTTQDALLSVHLLNDLPGREIDGEPGKSYPQKQVELARDNARARLVWVPKSLDLERVEDESHRAFLDGLENGEREEARYDFIRGVPAALAPQILEKLDELKTSPAAEGVGEAILLDTHRKDQLYAFELGRFLLENNIQPYINPEEDDPDKNLDVLEARLRAVSTLIIVFGNVNESWVRHRLGAALQISVIKKLPIKSYCVFSVPPEKQKEVLDFNLWPVPVRLIDNSKSSTIERAALAPLLNDLRVGGAA